MPKKTERRTKKRRADSLPKQSGLIAKGKKPQQSARTESVLDNRSHRTTLQIGCERKLKSFENSCGFVGLTMRTNRLFPQRLTASFAG